jgi:hypothetical protein
MQPLKRNNEDREPLQWLHVSSVYRHHLETADSEEEKLARSNTGAEDDSPIPLFFHVRDAQLGQLGTALTPSASPCRGPGWKRATDQECAARICPPTSFKFFDTGVFYLGLDTKRRPGHGGITVKDVRVPELLDDLRMHGAHSIEFSEICLECGDAHTGSAQFLDQRHSSVMLREIMQREMHAA